MTSSVKTYEFTAFTEADLLDGHIGKGASFDMPAGATVCFEAKDNDKYLSGDRYGHARDRSYQTAQIDRDGEEIGNGGQIYADRYFWVKDSNGKKYKLIEINQEGSSEKYFTFDKDYGLPEEGAHLTVTSDKNSGSIKYWDLDAGEKAKENLPPEFTNVPDDCIVCVDENGKMVIDLDAIDPDGPKASGDGDDDDDDDGKSGDGDDDDDDDGYSKNSAGDGDDDDDDDGKSGDGDDDDDDDGKSGDGDDDDDCDDGHVTNTAGDGDDDDDSDDGKSGDGDDDDDNDDGGSDDGLTFKITGGADKDFFEIDAETGKLSFKKAPDYENPEDEGADNTYEVEVGVMDEHGATTKKLLKVQVKDVEDEPDPDCIIIEAEDMHDVGFRVEHGDKASGGEFQMLKCAGGNGDLWTYFEGESGCYDLSLFIQDESDGQSEITVKINGQVVDVIKLDRDSDGKGDNNGHFSEFTLKHVDIEQGDKITFWVDGDKCEFVRFDKIVLKEALGSISGTVFCDDDCDGIQDPDVCVLGPDLIVNGDFEINSLNNEGVVFNAQDSDVPGWFFVGSRTADLLEENAEGHGNATGEAIIELDAGAILCQHVDIPEDCIYLLTIDVLENPHISANDNRFKIFIDGEEFEVVSVEGQQTLTFELDLKAGQTRLDFKSLSYKGDGPALAKVQLQKKTVEPGEAGKEGVTVTLLDADGNPVLDGDGNPITTVTDADGNYTFEDVPEGDYRVKFDAPDGTVFTEQNVGDDDTIDSDVGADGVSDLITVGKCEKVKDVDAGVKDAPEGSISGRYFCDEDCDGIEDAGEAPVVGITVRLLDGSGAEIATTVTDDNGEYEFTGLDAGDYQVVFDPDPSGKVFTLQDQGDDDTVDSDVDSTGTTGTITLGKGETVTDVDAGVKDPEDASIAGRLFCDNNPEDPTTDCDGLDNDGPGGSASPGVEGVEVKLLNAAGAVVATTTTAADGSYSFNGLAAGVYSVMFAEDPTGKEFTLQDQGGDDTIDSDVDGTGMTDPVTVGISEQVADVDAGVKDPGDASISGRLFCDNNPEDPTTDCDGLDNDGPGGSASPGVEGVEVKLLDAGGAVVATTTTAADGSYSFTGLKAGDYSVMFAEDPTGKEFTLQDQGGDDTIDSDVDASGMTGTVTVGVGEEVTDVDAGVKDPGDASISGRLFCDNNPNDPSTDCDGLDNDGPGGSASPGVEGVEVKLLNAAGAVVATTTTAADGSYSFTGLSAGVYSVMFAEDPTGKEFTLQDQGGDDTIDSDVDGTGMTDPITVGVGEQVADVDAGVKDPGDASISGRLFCDNNPDDPSTDCDGLDNDGPGGTASPGVEGVEVKLLDAAGAVVATTTTAADGSYSFTGLMAGDYSVMFAEDPTGKIFTLQDQGDDDTIDSDVDANGMTGTVTVGIGEEVTDVDAGVKEPPVETASLAGRYFCDENRNDIDDGEPGVAGVTVVLTDAAGNFVAETVTDSNGDYLFTDLDPGDYKVQFPGLPPEAGDDSLATKTDSALTFSIDNDLLINDSDPDGDSFTFDSFTQPLNGTLTDNGNGTLTYTPDAGFMGTDTFTYAIDDGDPQTPVSTATVSVEVADAIEIQSDDFSSGGLQAFWEFEGGTGSSAEVVVDNGEAFLAINVPSGDFDPSPFDGSNDAVRVRQKACDGDFQVEAKFLSVPGEQFEIQGIMVEQDADNWLRFDIRAQGSGNRLFVGHTTTDGGGVTELDISFDPADAAVMRVTRVGDTWTFETSSDGVLFVPQVTFDVAITANTVGPFGGTRQEQDGFQVQVDYFSNTALPVDFDDASLDALPPTKDFVAKDVGDDDTVDSDVDPANGMTDVITLEAGDNVTDVDAGVQGPPLGKIGDTVWVDSFGNGLLDDFEARLAGVNVQLLDGDGNVIAETTTAIDGTYLFQNLEAGDYQVQFNLPEPFEFTTQDAGDDTLDSDADPVTGRTGVITLDEGEMDFTVDAGVLRAGVIEGSSQADPNSPVNGNDLLVGSSQNDAIFGFSGDDVLIGNEGNDELFGQFDADTLEGGAGDDLIDGGQFATPDFGSADEDTAVYQNSLFDEFGNANYSVTENVSEGTFTVIDLNLADGLDEGTDTLVDIEFLQFGDDDVRPIDDFFAM